MTPERYRQIRAQFEAALEQPAVSRHRFLIETCAGDAELLAEVELMLNADQQAEGPIDKPAIPFESLATDHSSPVSFEGRVLGVWRLDRPIGHGGMGSVYLAHRADGAFHKRVAIKIMRADLNEQGFLQREGRPITAYCDLHNLDISVRLTLFHTVCLAVQHLHKHLVVHRDRRLGSFRSA